MSTGKVIKCRAAVLWGPDEKYSIEEIEVAPPKAREIRIKIVATALCHTDLHAQTGRDAMVQFPVILGHEGAGIVESVGEGVVGFKAGDHVIPLTIPQCRECKFCKNPKSNCCSKTPSACAKESISNGTSRFTCKGKLVHQFMGTSTFSEYTVVADIALCKIDDKAPLEKVCLLGCGVSTGYGAALNTAKVEKGSTCAVWGLGAVGLATIMGCKAAGASKIIGVDINPDKFKIAETFGCTDCVNPKDHDKPISEVLAEMTDGGLDYTFECIGNIGAIEDAFNSCHPGWGMAVVIGIAPLGKNISINPFQLLYGKRLVGSAIGGWKTVDSVPKLVNSYMNKEGLLLDEFITHNMTLDRLNEAVDLLLKGECIRTVINF